LGALPNAGQPFLTRTFVVVIPPGYEDWVRQAQAVFRAKHSQYGESWGELSFPSLVDLLYIKAQRIRTLLQQGGVPATGESPLHDWLALANYAALAALRLSDGYNQHNIEKSLATLYQEAQALLERKNTDYGEAWKHLRPLAFVEFILMKLARIRQMDGDLLHNAPAIRDNLLDIINYAFLFLVRYGDASVTA